jgi:hypothetical protein
MPQFSEPVELLNKAAKPVVRIAGEPQPTVSVMDDNLEPRITLNGHNGNLFLRAKKKSGQPFGDLVFMIDADTADLRLGGGAANGDLLVCPAGADGSAQSATLHYSAGARTLLLRSTNGQDAVRIDGGQANLWLGGNGVDGDLVIFPSTVANNASPDMATIHVSGDGTFSVRSGGVETIRLDGARGDIHLLNADGAEEFDIAEEGAEPGSVLVIENETRLRIADRPYDRRVAGIVSGAGDLRPGIVLGRRPGGTRVPVGLFGKVNCMVDAGYGAISAGDLLTTSATRGHAMRAEPGAQAVGAIVGKAMGALPAGRAMIPVLVGLQ